VKVGIFPQVILTALILVKMGVEIKKATDKREAIDALAEAGYSFIKWSVVFGLLYAGGFYSIAT